MSIPDMKTLVRFQQTMESQRNDLSPSVSPQLTKPNGIRLFPNGQVKYQSLC